MNQVLALLLAASCRAGVPLDSQPMPRVDVARYMGRWYEIARYPKWFERDCHGVTADYTLQADGTVAVINTCRKKTLDGKLATAKAWSVDPSGSRYKVQFFWPFNGPYWIVALDPDYRWAVVGHPKRTSLWILSRTPQLDPRVESDILRRIAALDYDPLRLERGGQPAARRTP